MTDLCFISQPRSGTHWFRHLSEWILQSSTEQNSWSQECNNAIYYSGVSRNNPKWGVHYHGYELDLPKKQSGLYDSFNIRIVIVEHPRILYLSRNIPDIIYSWCHMGDIRINEENMVKMVLFLKDHYYLYHNASKDICDFSYEQLQTEPLEILPKVFDFIGMEYTMERVEEGVKRMTKGEVLGHSSGKVVNTTEKYAHEKELFMGGYTDLINDTISGWKTPEVKND